VALNLYLTILFVLYLALVPSAAFAARSHAPVAYDANGDMTARSSQTLTWNVERQLASVSGGASFGYDGDGGRVKKTEAGETVHYPHRYYEKNSTTGVGTKYYYLGDLLISIRRGTAWENVHHDHLGGTTVTTNGMGGEKSRTTYYPFGATRSSTGTAESDRKYTGQRLDQSGLYFYNARYYDAGLGRFVSPDTRAHTGPAPSGFALLELAVSQADAQQVVERGVRSGFMSRATADVSPQELNRYSYATNNPLRYTDPDGHWAWVLVPVVASPWFWGAVFAVGFALTSQGQAVLTHQSETPAERVSNDGASAAATQVRGLPPPGVRPPVDGEVTRGPASRPSEAARGGQSLYDENGGEWRYFLGTRIITHIGTTTHTQPGILHGRIYP
jgi:RHS repeat-associated protein